MRNRKKKNKVYLYLLVILGITVGFALLSTTLYINGTAAIKSNTWNIHWDKNSISINQDSVDAEDPEVSTATTADDTVSFDVELEMPGDFFEFEIDAVNEGTVDGALDLSENWITYSIGGTAGNLPGYMEFSVLYDNENVPQSGDILKKRVDVNTPGRQTYRIRVGYKSSVTELPSNPQEVTITVELPYVQHKDTTPPPPPAPDDFATDSWETITTAVENGDTSKYDVGDTKEIEFDADGDGTKEKHYLRIVNTTTPDECLDDDFSQTACGFVLEFVDIITEHPMNPYTDGNSNGDGNYGGWQYSSGRTFVNTDIYNALPSALKSGIISTKVVSGHGKKESNNFTTLDRMYLAGTREIGLDVDGNANIGNASYDTAYNATRQLDYYHELGIEFTSPMDSHDEINKRTTEEVTGAYWLRTPFGNTDFCSITGGIILNAGPNLTGYGVAPLFRLGKDWVLTNSTSSLKEQKWEYYLNPRKKLQDGWYQLKDFSNNDQYYFFENGFMKLGWYTENNNTYYLSEFDGDNNNYVDGNRVHDVTLEIDGVSHTFDSNGVCTNCN